MAPTAAGDGGCGPAAAQRVPGLLSQFVEFVDTFVDFACGLPAAGPQVWATLTRPRPPVLAPAEHGPARRLVAVGDLHGDYHKTRQALRVAGVLDDADHWCGGDTVVVQVGDQLDRGPSEMAILLLLERLEVEAAAAGGRVLSMNGNHETMSVASDYRYVDPGGYRDFDRWRAWFSLGERWKAGCGLQRTRLATPPQACPLHAASRWQALHPGGPVATRFLSRQPTLLRVGGTLFAHGGALPEHVSGATLDETNRSVEQWILGNAKKQPRVTRGRNSIVWSRHFSREEEKTDCDLLQETLNLARASRMVVGHTIQPDLEVTAACRGRVYRIDVGMSAGCYGGEPAALEILDDRVVCVLTDASVAKEAAFSSWLGRAAG